MANGFQRVNPGDLITAASFNQLLDDLATLDTRVTALEGGSQGGDRLEITRLLPTAIFYRVGDQLTVLGSNFEFSQGSARVFLDGSRVQTFGAGSSDSQLVFIIPPVSGVQESGTEVDLRVANSTQQAIRKIVLRPPQQVLFGDVDVDFLAVNPTTIVPGQPATFQHRITSRASADADFLIDPLITVAANQSIWQSRLQVLDASGNLLPSRRLRLAQLQQRLIFVRITQVPTGTDGESFQLKVDASSGGVIGTSGDTSFQVGQPTTPPDTSISLNPIGVVMGQGTLSGDTLTVAPGQTVQRLRFLATFQHAVRHDLTLTTTGSGWTVGRFATTADHYDIAAGDIDPTTGVAEKFPEITVTPAATGAASSGRVDVRYQRDGVASSRVFPLNLSLGT